MLSSRKWNQGNLDQNPFPTQRERAASRLRIDAPVGHLFERACLAGPPAWLATESLGLVCTESGHDEANALWWDDETGPALLRREGLRTFWTTTRTDPERHRHQSVLVCPELAVGTLDVVMEARDGGTLVRFDLSCTVLSEAGSSLFDEGIRRRMDRLLERFGRSLTESMSARTAPAASVGSRPARRSAVEHERVIDGDIDECFALACPVAELRWIPGWHFDLVYSESGRNETGCVFLEPSTGLSILRSPGAHTYWYTTDFDEEQHRFDAVWLTGNLTLARWKLQMTDLGDGRIRVTWSLVYTGLGPDGDRLLGESGMEGRMKRALGFLATCLTQYVETGTMYRLSSGRKLRLVGSLIGATLGRHLRRRRTGGDSVSPAAEPRRRRPS